ncbi:hypothetical protein EJB05_58080, partial [Eragrostis curvula]
MVSATSAYLAALAQLALKVAAGKKISFMLTSKQTAAAGAGGTYRYAELYAVRLTALMVPPMFGAGDERGDCGEPIPSATVLPRLLEKLFDGEHPYASFLPPHTVALLHPAAAPQLE